MAFDYQQAALDAKAIIEEFGAAASFTVKGYGGSGSDIFGNPIPTEADTTISGTVTPLLQYKRMEIDETNIKTDDAYVFFDGALVSDDALITINGAELKVVKTKTLTSVGGVLVMQQIQLRRA